MSLLRVRPSFVTASLVGLSSLVLAAALVSGAMGLGAAGNQLPVPVAAIVRAPALPPAAPAVAASEPIVPAFAQPEPAADATLDRLALAAPGLDLNVLRLALAVRDEANHRGLAARQDLLTVIDYSLPSTTKRLWVLDVPTGKVLFHELVAHGKNSGDNYARSFSNDDSSLQTSLGLFRTVGTYQGKHGYSLKLEGLEPGFNDQAERRAVVVHAADYVSEEFAAQHGRLGRSWGCPALSPAAASKVIDTIRGGSLVFSYYPDHDWLAGSRFVAGAARLQTHATATAAAP